MHFLINEKKKIIFGYSAKCGCSHVKNIFYYYTLQKIPNVNNLHANSYGVLPKDHQSYKIILFIRNPYKRIVSGFIDKYCKGKMSLFRKSPIGRLMPRKLSTKIGTNYISPLVPLTFSNFVEILTSNGLDKQKNFIKIFWTKKQYKIDLHHFTPQLSERYKDNIKFHKIFDIENINYDYLNKLFNMQAPNSLVNNIIHRTAYNLHNAEYVGNKQYKYFHNNIPSYQYFYNKKTKEDISDFYKKDLFFFAEQGFNYDLSIPST